MIRFQKLNGLGEITRASDIFRSLKLFPLDHQIDIIFQKLSPLDHCRINVCYGLGEITRASILFHFLELFPLDHKINYIFQKLSALDHCSRLFFM